MRKIDQLNSKNSAYRDRRRQRRRRVRDIRNRQVIRHLQALALEARQADVFNRRRCLQRARHYAEKHNIPYSVVATMGLAMGDSDW